MAEDKKDFDINSIRNKIKSSRAENSNNSSGTSFGGEEGASGFSWSAVSKATETAPKAGLDNFLSYKIDFVGKNLEDGRFANENLENANFSVANLKGVDFSGANLKGVDFSGADLTGANLKGADLTGAVLSGAQLIGTDFTGANLKGVILTDADISDAILLDIEIDEIGLEELQALVEYLAKYYPHKLNLNRLNLRLLDLKRIDLKNLNLRGVDFTGVDFTGVNIMELDLSECIITPQQIAQALGRVPSAEELRQIMAPKVKKGKEKTGIDMTALFQDDGREFGTWNAINQEGISIKQILETGKKVFRRSAPQPKVKDEKILEEIKAEQKTQANTHKEELRRAIEEHKRRELESRMNKKSEFENEVKKEAVKDNSQEKPNERAIAERVRDMRIMNRGGNGR